MTPTPLPPDGHSHTQWSWDASAGSMEGSCARALALGLPAIAFTEHVDATRWVVPEAHRRRMRRQGWRVDDEGGFTPPALDVEGYLEEVERCRARFPNLRIVTGAELGEPHWFPDQSRDLLATGGFERVLASLHSVVVDGRPWAVDHLLAPGPEDVPSPHDVVRAYLEEVVRLVDSPHEFAVLAHVDFPLRSWPGGAGAFDYLDLEEEFRTVLRALAASGRALEFNTRVPLGAEVVGWWREEGGQAVAFGSDAHHPVDVGRGFHAAAAMVEAHGFRPGRRPHDFWLR